MGDRQNTTSLPLGKSSRRLSRRVDVWCRNNAAWTTSIALYFTLNLLMFSWGYHMVRDVQGSMGIVVGIAKGSGRMLSFGLATLFLSCCKCWATALRDRAVRAGGLPMDCIPALHRLIGITVLCAAFVHSCAHAAYWFLGAESLGSPTKWFPSITYAITGEVMIALFSLIGISALPQVRRSSLGMRFFSLAHAPSALIMMITLFLHSTPALVGLLALPALLYVIDLAIRCSRIRKSRVPIVSCQALKDGRLVRLELEKPPGFVYKAGQYAYLNVPCLSKTEFHPFTIASAPGDRTLCFFIKDAGRWTHKLYQAARSSDPEAGINIAVSVLGPYGAPSQEVHRFKQIMLIAGGVGVTPMMSIFKHYVHECPEKSKLEDNSSMSADETDSSSDLSSCEPSDTSNSNVPCPVDDRESSNVSDDHPIRQNAIRASSRYLADLNSQAFAGEDENRRRISVQLMTEVLSGDRRMHTESANQIVLQANNWLRGIGIALALCWLSLLGISSVSSVALLGVGRTGIEPLAIGFLASEIAVLVSIVIFGLAGFGSHYCVSAFFLWDVLPLLGCTASLGSFIVSPAITRNIGFFAAAQSICSLRLLFTLWIAGSHAQDYNNLSVPAEEVNRIHMVWVTRTLKEAKWLIEETERWAPRCQKKFSCTVYLTQEKESQIEEFLAQADHQKSQLRSGRPNWHKELQALQERNHSTACSEPTGVFFCGKSAMGASVRRACLDVEILHGESVYTSNALKRECQCRLVYHEENF